MVKYDEEFFYKKVKVKDLKVDDVFIVNFNQEDELVYIVLSMDDDKKICRAEWSSDTDEGGIGYGHEAEFDYDTEVVFMGDNSIIYVDTEYELLSDKDKCDLSKHIDEFIKAHLKK